MNSIKPIFMILLIAVLTACAKPAEQTTKAGVEFMVDRLFTVDRCTVYRFNDGGNNKYFTNCHGSVQWRESCGKSCQRDESIDGGAP